VVTAFRALGRAGATEVCICCNTAHPFARSAAAAVCIPFLDMIVATAEAALLHLRPSQKRPLWVGILSTDATLEMGLYQEALRDAALRLLGCADMVTVLLPGEESVRTVQDCILAIKAGALDGVGERIEVEAKRLVAEGAQCVITGCTELPVCFNEDSHPAFPTPIVSPVRTLAAAIVRRTQGRTVRTGPRLE
jgi:aspartate racemase